MNAEFNRQVKIDLNHNWGWFLGWGIVLTLLGISAILAASFTTWLSIVVIGIVLLSSGIVILIDSFQNWWSKESGFAMHFIIGILYGLFGIVCLAKPLIAAEFLTLLLAIFFITSGVARIIFAQSLQLPGWGWNVVSGILSLILGILIIAQWPVASLFIIGLFIGIDLFFLGWSYIMISFLSKKAA